MKIIIEVETNEDKEKIEYYVKEFVKVNFQKYKDATINIEI